MNQNSDASAMRFRVRFNGELLPGFAKETAIVNVAKAYNVAPDDIAKWFTAGGVTLREEATSDELAGLESFFNKHGLRLEITSLTQEPSSFKPELDDAAVHSHDEKSIETESSAGQSGNDHSGSDYSDNNHSGYGQAPAGNAHEVALEDLQKTLSQLTVLMRPKELEGFVPASFAKRTIAFILDYFIMSFLSLILIYLLGTLGVVDITPFQEYFSLAESTLSVEELMANAELQPVLEEMVLSFSIWVSVTFILYFSLMERFYGASLGKKVFNIRIYSLRTGSQLGWNTVLIRTFLFYLGINFLPAIPFIGVFLFLATILWATRDPIYKRTVYDNLSGTIVGSVPKK